MINLLMRIVILLVMALAAGCVVPVTETAGSVAPVPARIVIDNGVVEYGYAPGDPQFKEVAGAVAALIAGVTHRARTFYPPARFEAEIAPLPHVAIEYEPAVTLSLAGEDVAVQQAVFAVVAGEPLLLVQSPGATDWSVFLVDEQVAARFSASLETIASK